MSGLPLDAKCVRAGYDPSTDDALFIFESAEFPEVPPHLKIPELVIKCETIGP